MKSIARMILKPGMVLADDVVSYKNDIILSANTVLDELMIAKLERHSIMCVSIKEPSDFATTHFEKVRLSPNFIKFDEVYHNNLNAYKYMINTFLDTNMPVNISYLLQIHDNIKNCANTGEQLLDFLYNMIPNEDEFTYAHCLNAALISTVFGTWLCLPTDDIKTLTLCGFFYDIGKLKLPPEIIWKPGKLTDFEYSWVKSHTTLGYDLIKNQKLNPHVINATLMHHERADGSGYPNGLFDSAIDPFAKYIAIVDAYDAMTSARTYRQSLNPFQVIANFEDMGYHKFDSAVLKQILEHIANSQVGRTVRLNSDEIADIMLINKNDLSHPLIKLHEELVDLSKQSELEIVSML